MSETKPFDQQEYRLPNQEWTEQQLLQHGGSSNVASLAGEAMRIATDGNNDSETIVDAPEASPDFLTIKSSMDHIQEMRVQASQYAGIS